MEGPLYCPVIGFVSTFSLPTSIPFPPLNHVSLRQLKTGNFLFLSQHLQSNPRRGLTCSNPSLLLSSEAKPLVRISASFPRSRLFLIASANRIASFATLGDILAEVWGFAKPFIGKLKHPEKSEAVAKKFELLILLSIYLFSLI